MFQAQTITACRSRFAMVALLGGAALLSARCNEELPAEPGVVIAAISSIDTTCVSSFQAGDYWNYSVFGPYTGMFNDLGQQLVRWDRPEDFGLPQHVHGDFIWFTRGFVEYRYILPMNVGPDVTAVTFTAEMAAEVAGFAYDYPSLMRLLFNGQLVGSYTMPGDPGVTYGGVGRQEFHLGGGSSQFGFLASFRVEATGTYLKVAVRPEVCAATALTALPAYAATCAMASYVKVSNMTLDDLDLTPGGPLFIRLDIPGTSGINLYGDHWGDFDLDPTLTIERAQAPLTIQCPPAQTVQACGVADFDDTPVVTGGECGGVNVACSQHSPASTGEYDITCTATGTNGEATSCTYHVSVAGQNTPPTISACPVVSAECTGQGGATVDPGAVTASDTCSASTELTYSSDPDTSLFSVGTHQVEHSVCDPQGMCAETTCNVVVVDTQPPSVWAFGRPELFPPNHFYVEVGPEDCGIEVLDGCYGGLGQTGAAVALVSATSDEVEDAPEPPKSKPDNGDGATLNDIQFVSATRVRVRAERQGNGNGRVYNLLFAAEDPSGNRALAGCAVVVPHDQSRESRQSVIDDGPHYSVGNPFAP